MQIKVNIPNNFHPERKYAIDILLRYFKEVSYEIISTERDFTTFSFNNKPFLKIKDGFWNKHNESDFDYKSLEIPQNIEEINLQFGEAEIDLLSIFGDVKYSEANDCLTLHSDIIASTFFMLTRWEEYTSNERDKFNRFPDEASILHKNDYMHRPLVNEYIDFFKLLLSQKTGAEISYNRKYKLHITHDVDEIFRYRPFFKFVKVLGGDLLIRKSLAQFFKTLNNKIKCLLNKEKDPSDTVDYLMDVSEKYKNISKFYFIPGEKGEQDFRYSISSEAVKNIIDKINKRGHKVGIHPSLETNGNAKNFDREVERLSKIHPNTIDEGRHHYLAFQVPFSWRYWNQNKIKFDSSLGYRKGAGYRCGICYAYPVFDILERETLEINELPLTFMEVGLTHIGKSPKEFTMEAKKLSDIVKKYNGDFVLLWHNNNINHPFYTEYGKIYEKIIANLS